MCQCDLRAITETALQEASRCGVGAMDALHVAAAHFRGGRLVGSAAAQQDPGRQLRQGGAHVDTKDLAKTHPREGM